MEEHIYKAAIYVRLSKEDGDVADAKKAESNSISNQKSLILNYLKDKKDIEVVSVREDDGYSGANFERPGFQMMMQDVKDGKVDCIVVKDLSRFGREYIDAGRYIERLFPAMGVRFIAINDNYDSLNGNDQSAEIVIPFKNLINDAYCRDISVKIRSHLEVKRQNGEYVGNYCPYGYKKSPENHNVIIPDEYAGHVVQDIFKWIKSGMSIDRISKKLNTMGVASPMEYKIAEGINYKTVFKKQDKAMWSATAVRRIATNPIYTGTLIQGKMTTPNHKIKTMVAKDKEKWAVVEDNHEALVSARDFRIVQRLLGTDTRTAPSQNTVYTLSGIAVCADCGNLMARKCSTVGGKKYAYYMCSNHKNFKKCTPHRIREDILEAQVLQAVQETISKLAEADEVVKEAGRLRNNRIDLKKIQERIEANEEDINKFNKMLVSLYEDYKDGVVGREDFILIKDNFELKKKEAELAIRSLQEEAGQLAEGKGQDDSWIEDFKAYRNISELNRVAAVNLLEQIKVYEGHMLEVVFDCDDEIRQIMDRAEEIRMEDIERRAETDGQGDAGSGVSDIVAVDGVERMVV